MALPLVLVIHGFFPGCFAILLLVGRNSIYQLGASASGMLRVLQNCGRSSGRGRYSPLECC